MGKKSKRSGVVWSQDTNTGSPMGRNVREWDGVSRTSKRNQKKVQIDEQKTLLLYCIALSDEILASIEPHIQEALAGIEDEDKREELFDMAHALFEILPTIRQMKKGGAKQRLIKHMTSTFSDEEWKIMEQMQELSKE